MIKNNPITHLQPILKTLNRRSIRRGLTILLAVFISLNAFSLPAQEENLPYNAQNYTGRYSGDIGLWLNVYMFIPMFNLTSSFKVKATNLLTRGGASVSLGYYFTRQFFFGGSLDIFISNSQTKTGNVGNSLLAVAIGPKVGYDFNIYIDERLTAPFITIPLMFTAAFSMAKYGKINRVLPLIKPEVGVYVSPFNIPEWSLGASVAYLFYPEIVKSGLSRIGNYLTVSVGVNYHSGI